jgi:hypothetical protein
MTFSFGRMSGMMTARFLLHLRKWEAKRSGFSTTSNESPGENSVMEFTSNPHQRASRSYVDDFGEDPVRRAEQNRGRHDLSLAVMSEYHV